MRAVVGFRGAQYAVFTHGETIAIGGVVFRLGLYLQGVLLLDGPEFVEVGQTVLEVLAGEFDGSAIALMKSHGLAHRLGPLGRDDGAGEDKLRRLHVFLHLRGREHERRAVVVEAVVERVVRETSREIAMDIEQVRDGVLVFGAVHPPQHHLAAGSLEHTRSAGKL